MARHFMAVCVVCLLCAEHLPCKEHIEKTVSNQRLDNEKVFRNNFKQMTMESKILSNKITDDHAIRISNQYTKRKGRTKGESEIRQQSIRKKRHTTTTTDHQHIHSNHETADEFLKKLFHQFGNADGTSMNVFGFEKMLRQLGLYNLIEDKIPRDNQLLKFSKTNETCISSLDLISRLSSGSHQTFDNHQNDELIHTEQLTSNIESLQSSPNSTKDQLQNERDNMKTDVRLLSDDLYSICPILLYQLAAPTSLERSGCIDSSLIPHNVYLPTMEREDRLLVWVYATASVLGVSLVGLLGVAVIPCMDRHFYQHVIQFLVALAVGTLAGDALLHLLPHSMVTFASEIDGHVSMTWKGLIAVLGIIFFFATERGLTMMAEWRKKIEKKEKPSSRVRVMRDPDSLSMNNSTAGDKLCKHKYSSYPYCYDEIAMDTKDDHHHHHQDPKNTDKIPTPIASNKNNIHTNFRNKHDHGDTHETAESLLPHNYTTISDSFSVMNNKDDGNIGDNNTISTNLDDASIDGTKDKELVREETFTIILREHESSHHGHSHKHGHVHSPPRSLSAVAWMVVMGDGLHNFTDGMAIGAAFSNNIAGGFSTAIAVFCHELPHELGDFAVLLKAGMSARQAVYYNVLSSVLSFMGMVLGVLIGETPEASAWVFACAAGMFIYIALVDMMPELTSTHNERCALSQCLLQLLGMIMGLGIMLIIALYEDDLKQIFTTSSNLHHLHQNH